MKKYLIYVFVCFSFASFYEKKELLSFENQLFYDVDFFSNISYSDWVSFDKDKKLSIFNDFLKRELVFFHAQKTGLINDPFVQKKINLRKNILLINNTYEHLVARPLISKSAVLTNKENLKKKVFVSHLLFDFSGFNKEDWLKVVYYKNNNWAADNNINMIAWDVFEKTEKIKLDLSLEKNKKNMFLNYAQKHSKDPSVIQNKGVLGWVPWGVVVDAFQSVVFDLAPGEVSSQIITPYGIHLALVDSVGFSDFFYYPKNHYNDLSYKAGMRNLNFDTLQILSKTLDSSFFKLADFRAFDKNVLLLLDFIEDKNKQNKLQGNKNSLLNNLVFFKNKNKVFPLFSYKSVVSFEKNVVGVGWLIDAVKSSPATKISSIKTKDDFVFLVKNLLLERFVLALGKKEKIDLSFSYKHDVGVNLKGLLFNEYVSFLINNVFVDSLEVLNLYNKGVFNKEYIKPKQVVLSEIRFSVFEDASLVLNRLNNGEFFDSLLKEFKGKTREPISFSKGNSIGEVAFGLNEGDLSNIIKNPDGSFSIVKIISFIPEVPFKVERVYSQIERKIIKQKQKEIKNNLLDSLRDLYKVDIRWEVLGL